MQKLILDTNVFVSALISNSIPTKIVFDLVLPQKVEISLSEEIFAEYIEVMNRKKFTIYKNFTVKADIVLNKIFEISTFYKTDRNIKVLKDISDNKFLELSSISSADYLITGNTQDFKITEFERTKILTPREYWDNYKLK